ncbi:hypothetical protein GCM10009689_08840 [Brevibacterium antiquum]
MPTGPAPFPANTFSTPHPQLLNISLQRGVLELRVWGAELSVGEVAGGSGPRASAEEVDEGPDAEGDGCQQGEQEFESGADADRLE